MVTASILGTNPIKLEDDHVAIIRHIRFNETLHGGWDEWSVACICGELYEPRYKGYYIPSRVQAERIFNDHAGNSTRVREGQEIHSEDSPESGTEACPDYYRTDGTLYV